MNAFEAINPATENKVDSYPLQQEAEVLATINKMHQIQGSYAKTQPELRKKNMQALAQGFKKERQSLATLMTSLMGKPITQSLAEIDKCAQLCDFYAEHSAALLQPEIVQTEHYKSYRCFEPLGIVFGIMPWNAPFWQVMRFSVPNIMAGNAALLKHAPNCIAIGEKISDLFLQAGFPEYLFANLRIDLDLVPQIIHHPAVAGVTLTGSNRAGQSVAMEAGKALKKVVLELGGSDPYVILKDADLNFAANQCLTSRLTNCGQVCIAAKRLIVVKEVRAAFEKLLLQGAKTYQMGDPMDPATRLGPMARADLRTSLHSQVERSIAAGARCVLGGSIPQGKGYFYPATLLLDVEPHSPAFQEELFGPVICLIEAKDEAEALTLANQTSYGLGAAVFTSDLDKGERLAKEILQAGTCVVNGFVASDPRLPFGGIKQSGFGRELSIEGLREFLNIKTVIVDKAG